MSFKPARSNSDENLPAILLHLSKKYGRSFQFKEANNELNRFIGAVDIWDGEDLIGSIASVDALRRLIVEKYDVGRDV